MNECFNLAVRTLKGRLISPYQREGVMWMLMRELAESGPKGGFLCDEMGLGKTVQTISTILGNPVKHTLIVVPKSIVTQWAEEIETFAPHLKVGIHDGPYRTQKPQELLGYDVVITPYSVTIERGKAKGEPTIFHSIRWGRIILDEGHEIRNPKSKVSLSLRTMQSNIRWVLTGTPIFNSMQDFVTLSGFLGIPKSVVLGMTERVRNDYVLRRTKEDVAKFNIRLELPPCDFENVELDMYPDEQNLYNDVWSDSHDFVKTIFKQSDNVGAHTMHILECLLRCRQVMIHPQIYLDSVAKKEETQPDLWEGNNKKMETLVEMVKSHPKEKSLVFSQFIAEMDIVHDLLGQEGLTIFRIDGSVSKEIRTEQIKQFRSCTTHCAFLIQIKAGGQGLNLQDATRVYITSPSWNPATELQAIGRAHRTGQTQKVYVRKLIYKGTEDTPSVEESIMNLQGHKAAVSAQVLNDPRLIKQIPTKSKSGVTLRDLKKLFSHNSK